MPQISRKEMTEITIGPKYLRSAIPVGTVSRRIWQEIERAEEGTLGKQVFKFNMYLGVETTTSGRRQDVYYEAHAINGACRFRRYNILTKIQYKIVQKLDAIWENISRMFERG